MGFGENGIKLTEARHPQTFELQKQRPRARQLLRIRTYNPLAALRVFADQPSLLKYGDMLLHGGKRHRIARGEHRDGRRLTRHDACDDIASCGVGEGTEDSVELVIRELRTCNHMVVR